MSENNDACVNHPYIQDCIEAIKRGDCIAYPTEGVWGLGCDPMNESAVKKILRMKQRPSEKGLILVASRASQVDFLINELAPQVSATLRDSWPGHTTWLIPHRGQIPSFISGASDKVAVRVSAHPVVKALCDTYGRPIVSTSANLAGMASAITREEVESYFSEEALCYAPGEVGEANKSSTIIDALSMTVLRE